MLRIRFSTKSEDFRPVTWPPVGPYWCSGYTGDNNPVLVAYVNSEEDVFRQWPEAEELDVMSEGPIVFTDRFSKPDWWTE
jgi:hypothetical protein